MPDSEVISAGAEAPESSVSASEGMTEDQAAESFLADLEGRSSGTINDDPIAAAHAADGAPPAEAPAEQPEAAPEGETPAEQAEPLPEGKPFSYAEGKAADFIQTVGDEGAIIEKDALPRLAEVFTQRDAYEAQARQLGEQVQQIEAVGGMPRIAELTEQVAMLDAAGTRFLGLLKDPTGAGLMQLLMYAEDGKSIVPNPQAVRDFLEKIESDTKIARYGAKEKLGETFRAHTQRQSEQVQAGQREQVRASSFEKVLVSVQREMPSLTADDLDEARAAFGPMLHAYERPATPQEAAAFGIPAGSPVLDPAKMAGWFQARAARNARTTSTQTAQAKATTANAAKLRQAVRTNSATPAQRPGAGKAPPPGAKNKIAPDDDGTFEYIKRRSMVGQFATQDG